MLRREFLLSIASPALCLPIYPTEWICSEEEEYTQIGLGDSQKVDYIFNKKICNSTSCYPITEPDEFIRAERCPSLEIVRNDLICDYGFPANTKFEITAHIKYLNYDDYADDCWKNILVTVCDHREIRQCLDLEMMRATLKSRGKKLTDVFLDTYMRFEHEPIEGVQIHSIHLRKYIDFMEDKLMFDGQFKEYDILVGMDLSNKDNFIVPMKDDMYGCAVLDPDCVVLGQVGHA